MADPNTFSIAMPMENPDNLENMLIQLLENDAKRMQVLEWVQALNLPDCWVAAGFVRNLIWDYKHALRTPINRFDIDVIYYDTQNLDPGVDLHHTLALQLKDRDLTWEVKNQARMHLKNADRPYHNSSDAVAHWPETATAIAARLSPKNSEEKQIEILAPYGLNDAFNLVVRPTRYFRKKKQVFKERMQKKNWAKRWENLYFEI